MVKNAFLIVVAASISAVIMYWQFFTSDIHPYTDTISINDIEVKLKLTRKAGTGNVVVTLPEQLHKYNPVLYYKIDTVKNEWETRYFMKEDTVCLVYLPMHHKGVRVEYKIHYIKGLEEKIVPDDNCVKIRFKGEVPRSILILHILFLELALVLSVWLGINSIVRKTSDERVLWLNVIAIFVGGILLGIVLHQYAYGYYWSGFPLGADVSGNKLSFIFINWCLALFYFKNTRRIFFIVFSSLVTIVAYCVPHEIWF